jgi:hypothetical protein
MHYLKKQRRIIKIISACNFQPCHLTVNTKNTHKTQSMFLLCHRTLMQAACLDYQKDSSTPLSAESDICPITVEFLDPGVSTRE